MCDLETSIMRPWPAAPQKKNFFGRLCGGDLLAEGTTGRHPASRVCKFTYSRCCQVDGPQWDFEINVIAREHISLWHKDMYPNNLRSSFNNPLLRKFSNKLN